MAQLVREPACRAGDPGLNPGPRENFSIKLLILEVTFTLGFHNFILNSTAMVVC